MQFRRASDSARNSPVVISLGSVIFLANLFCFGSTAAGQDVVELLGGTRLEGRVVEIRQADRDFDFELSIAGTKRQRTLSFAEVHAVTMKGKRYVLTKKESSDGPITRSDSEVRQLIDQAGADFPDWYDDETTNYPESLDLSWPEKPEGNWNNKRNVGQYIWDIINPNPRRWRSGVKLVHQIMETHTDDAKLLRRDYRTLGRMYFELLQDFPRAAYWLEKGEVSGREGLGVKLAECYLRLGSRTMAARTLKQPALPFPAVKLLAEMGQLERALRLAKAFEGSRVENDARILAADALRLAGRSEEAIEWYQKVVQSDSYRNPQYEQRFKGRARDSIEAIQLFDQADLSSVEDGAYRASSVGYNGPLEIEVLITAGKIESLDVTQHREKQFYSALDDTPAQIIKKQSVLGVDGFSGATITSNAIINATAKALSQDGGS